MPGPVPNREADLARPRSRKGSDQREVTKGEMREVTVPEMDENWHPIAKMVWESLFTSGQSDFYQDSDVAFAYSLCEELTLYKNPKVDQNGNEYHKRSPEMFKALLSAMGNLLMTEADRRRVRIELQAPETDAKDPAVVLVMGGYRDALEEGPDGDTPSGA